MSELSKSALQSLMALSWLSCNCFAKSSSLSLRSMSSSEKTPDLARVRFRDGDDLVEFEGSTKNVKRSNESDPRANSPTKVRKSSKKNTEGTTADNSSASELENAKGSKLGVGNTKHRNESTDTEARPVKPPPPPPPPVPPARPPPPTTFKTETESAVDDPRSSLEERSEDLKLKYYSAFQVTFDLFLP